MKATVFLNSWAARRGHAVEVLKETPKRYLVLWVGDSCFKFVKGEKYYVPKYSVLWKMTNDPSMHRV